MNIVFIGFKNSGKSSVGLLSANKLHYAFVDTDQLIEVDYYRLSQKKLSARQIYQEKGEDYFRILEKDAIDKLKLISGDHVIATGGGCVLNPNNIDVLKSIGKLIYLDTPVEVLLQRIQAQVLPVFLEQDNFYHVYQERKSIYEAVADYVIDTRNKSVEEIAHRTVHISNQVPNEVYHGQ